MNTQKIGRTRRAKLLRDARLFGYERYQEITLTSEQEERWESGSTIAGREIHGLSQSDTNPSIWGYLSRTGKLLVGPAGGPYSADRQALDARLADAFGEECGHDQYAQCKIYRL